MYVLVSPQRVVMFVMMLGLVVALAASVMLAAVLVW